MPQSPQSPASKYIILYVDDELLSLKYFEQIVGEDFQVMTASSAEDGLKVVAQYSDSIAIVVSDQRLRGLQGTSFLAQLREKYPDIVRILATAYSDIATAISAINDGAIYHYINKPWEPGSLVQTLRRAMEYFLLREEKERLLLERASLMRQLIASDRLAGYGALAEGMNHHLRNALVPVQTYLQLAVESQTQGGSLPPGMDASFLRELHDSAKTQLRRITDTLGRLASVPSMHETAEGEQLDISNLWYMVMEQLGSLFEERQIALGYSAPPNLPPVHCNRNRLCHIFRLVLEDELDHLHKGQAVQVTISYGAATPDQPEHFCMEITDTGPIIPDARLATVFTPFFMRPENPQYLGMNLATCYVTLHNLGGWARAYNDEHRGTVLALCLPVRPGTHPGAKPSMEAMEKVISAMSQPAA